MSIERQEPTLRVRRILAWIYRSARNILALIGLLFVVQTLFLNLDVIVSGSMSPALKGDGAPGSDWLLSERVSCLYREPRRWNIVRFRDSQGFLIAKRIVGLPGETISLDDFNVHINGEMLDIPEQLSHLKYYAYGSLHQGKEVACGDEYFLLGDDSRDSADSRFGGTVSADRMLGRAWMIVWPPDRFGFVDD